MCFVNTDVRKEQINDNTYINNLVHVAKLVSHLGMYLGAFGSTTPIHFDHYGFNNGKKSEKWEIHKS